MKSIRNLFISAATGLTSIVATAVVTALITGQPLSGLTRARVVWRALAHGSVPAWALFVALLLVLYGIYYAWTHPPRWLSKGKVHFVPDAHNCAWADAPDGRISLTLGGMITYEGDGTLTVLSAFLKGTRPLTDMGAQVILRAPGREWYTVREIELEAHSARRVFLHMNVSPLIGTPGKSLWEKVVFHDKYNRDFLVGPIEFQYRGKRKD